MIYYNINDIVIRDMIETDPEVITKEEHLQGWIHQKIEKYTQRLQDVADNKCVALVAEYKGNVAGYFNVYFNTMCGLLGGKGFPELIDLGVFKKYRNHGIGTVLLQVAEQVAKKYADTVVIGMGLHRDYGSAQRMYVKNGYIPDGSGIWWQGKPLEPYADLKNDDEVAIYFSKKL